MQPVFDRAFAAHRDGRLEDAERRIEVLTERGEVRPAPASLTNADADRQDKGR